MTWPELVFSSRRDRIRVVASRDVVGRGGEVGATIYVPGTRAEFLAWCTALREWDPGEQWTYRPKDAADAEPSHVAEDRILPADLPGSVLMQLLSTHTTTR